MSAWPPPLVNQSIHPAKCRANCFWDRKSRAGSRKGIAREGGRGVCTPFYRTDTLSWGTWGKFRYGCAAESFKPWTCLRKNDRSFSHFRDPLSYSSVLFLVTQRSSSFGGRRKHHRSFLRSSLPHSLWDDNERVCRRRLFRPLWIFV